ncbi:MAG: N-acetylglucosamine-6-phosphate deacetylase [Spirochaetales bacterium]|nr:N-acetylglucosamine-6-phosphate deacetylase [Spirochaetales bacterium]MBQ2259649.1 N-acetylglucosamine-6-phosphate deacetylase [Spirochaetales bacterium]
MSNLHIKNAAIISDGTRDDNRELWITDGVFTEKIPGVEYETIDAEGLYALPGFIDTHIHGFGGKGTEDGDKNSILKMSEILAKTGVTSFFPTIYTDTQERIIRDIKACTEASGEEKGASIAGIHVEGPFISPDRIGAQNPLGRLSPSKDDFMNMLNAGKGLIKAMTMASELDGIEEIAKLAIENNVKPLLGHTNANYEETVKGASFGITHATHLFNAMSGLHHRNPGVVGAVLSEKNMTAEIIADGKHVAPAAIKAVFAAKGKEGIVIITDSLRPTLQEDGVKTANGVEVEMGDGLWVTKGRPELIQGSTLSMDIALKNLVSWGISIEDASYMLSASPADIYKLSDRGRIKNGLRADLVLMDKDLNLKMVIVKGEIK